MPERLERCVKHIMSQGKDKGTAFAICTAALKRGEDKESYHYLQVGESFIYLDPETFDLKEVLRDDIPEQEEIQVLEAEESRGGYLVTDDKGGKHLPTEKNGGPDRGLAGAAWAALHKGYRGNKYEGPDKEQAIAKLKALYKREGWDLPSESSDDEDKSKAEATRTQTTTTSGSAATHTVVVENFDVAANSPPSEIIKHVHAHAHKHGDEEEHSHEHQHDEMHDEDKDVVHAHYHPDGLMLKDEKKKESVRTSFMGETMSLKEAVIDVGTKTVQVTLIQPGWSQNGRYYSKETLAKAVSVFEGSKCYVDHPTLSEEKDRPERSVADIAGYYRDVKQSDGGALTAKLVLVGRRGDEMFPLVQETIANKPDLVGVSINALGKTSLGEVDGRKGVIVEEIAKAFGTDIVTTPSAGGKFDRLMASGDEFTTALLQSLEYDEWKGANPRFLAKIREEMKTLRKEELQVAALKEVDTQKQIVERMKEAFNAEHTRTVELEEVNNRAKQELADKVKEYENRVSSLVADQRLTESKLPKTWADALKPNLVGKPAAEMDTLIEAEKKKYFAVKQPIKVNTGTPISETELDPRLTFLRHSFGVDPRTVPFPNERPEDWAERVRKIRGV